MHIINKNIIKKSANYWKMMVSKIINKKTTEKWTQFQFRSDYYGSHQELGDKDKNILYMFSPKIIIPEKFINARFEHGSKSQNEINDEFDQFIESLDNKDFIEIDMS